MDTQIITSKGEIIIRIATVEDAAALLTLRLEALRMHPEAFAADFAKTAADGEKAWVERILEYENMHSGAIMIACVEDRLIGMSGIVRGHWPKTQHSGSLWGIFIKPEWRGFRICETIVNECIEWALKNGLVIVTLGVTTSNKSAIHCYTRCGFHAYGTASKALYYEGNYYDDLLMAKQIR